MGEVTTATSPIFGLTFYNLNWSKHRHRWCVLALSGFKHNCDVLSDSNIIQVTIDNLGHHGWAFLKRHICDAIRIGIAASHDTVTVDLALTTGRLPFGFAETERAQCSWVKMHFAARLARFDGQLTGFGLIPKYSVPASMVGATMGLGWKGLLMLILAQESMSHCRAVSPEGRLCREPGPNHSWEPERPDGLRRAIGEPPQ